ncbi:TPA: GntR family transcriptional regulator [Enterococcus faecalis]
MNKFHDIFLELEQQIVQGDYQPGDLLPSENQLVETYNVSRETIRKALNLLINAGYIQKKQGKGSIVLNFKKFNFPISGVTSYKEGWHLTAQSSGLTQGSENLQGTIAVRQVYSNVLRYDETTNEFTSYGSILETAPNIPIRNNWTMDLGGDAKLLANATAGNGQGLWKIGMWSTSLTITTSAYGIKAGNYTGNITWNLVAGPSI